MKWAIFKFGRNVLGRVIFSLKPFGKHFGTSFSNNFVFCKTNVFFIIWRYFEQFVEANDGYMICSWKKKEERCIATLGGIF